MQRNTTAPMTDATNAPKVVRGIQPTKPTSQPPKNPPMMPTIIFNRSPAPLPRTIRLASHPATKPISRYHNQNITIQFNGVRFGVVQNSYPNGWGLLLHLEFQVDTLILFGELGDVVGVEFHLARDKFGYVVRFHKAVIEAGVALWQ